MTNNTDTLVTFAATTRAVRFWVGTDAAGNVAQFWTKEPTGALPGLTITAHVIMPLGAAGAAAGWEAAPALPAAEQPADEVRAIAKRLSDETATRERDGSESGEWYEAGRLKGIMEFKAAMLAALPAAAPAPESQPAGLRVTLQGNRTPLEVWGEECLAGEFAPHRFVVHHELTWDMLDVDHFTVTHMGTGWAVGDGDSVEAAITKARQNLSTLTPEQFSERVNDAAWAQKILRKPGAPAMEAPSHE